MVRVSDNSEFHRPYKSRLQCTFTREYKNVWFRSITYEHAHSNHLFISASISDVISLQELIAQDVVKVTKR